MKKTKLALFQSVMALVLCLSMLMGTTFAWFTDGVSSHNNLIATGNLDVELEYRDASGAWQSVTPESKLFQEDALWEPGHTEIVYLKLSNQGSLALQYQFGVSVVAEVGSTNVEDEAFLLSDHILFGVVPIEEDTVFASREEAIDEVSAPQPIRNGYVDPGELYPADNGKDLPSEEYVALIAYMPETVGNVVNYKSGANIPSVNLGVAMVATQFGYESDSFGTDYDAKADMPDFEFPIPEINETTSVEVEKDAEGRIAVRTTLRGALTSADVPAGVQMEDEAANLTLSVNTMDTTGSNLTMSDNESMLSVDVHMAGVSSSNDVPMTIALTGLTPKGLNSGNLKLYHVENGETVAMTEVASDAAFTAHNQFMYDPATGSIELYLATFSEVAMVADTVNAWKGEFDYSWYTKGEPYTIANADQLAGFGAIVGGMNGQTKYDFAGKTVKLLSDINLGDKESKNNEKIIFYPIGYYNNTGEYARTSDTVTSNVSSFSGTFDGAGHTISNFYQNTWEMFGDYNEGYSAGSNYYKDGMGLFGYVLNGKVTNLTVSNFSSDGEFTPTGVIAAYAVNSKFENIAITNCNPRVYNTGNGGIIGIAGNTNDQGTQITLKNITVDNSNKISALWGSWDVACGGLVGMFRGNADGGNGKIHFDNCHVSAQIDVNNDVCANYQYYAYRYAGMIIGSVRHNEVKDGKTLPNMAGITATGCTVNYGDWNDYYYCELVANSLASYTHDHQFSRLTKVDVLPETASGTAHYYVKNADGSITCRHFIDGKLHKHEDAGTEPVNGETVAVEDKTCVYLPFDQMFTGYGWGVDSQSIDELAGIENLGGGIKPGTQDKSEVKFVVNADFNEISDHEIRIGDLFKAVPNMNIVSDAIQVSVTDLTEDDVAVTGTYTPSTTDKWEDGTITLSGEPTGKISITIQDYNFCKPTTAVFENGSRVNVDTVDRFAAVFDTDPVAEGVQTPFLYRVGNKNAVKLESLFKLIEGVDISDIGTVMIDVTPLEENIDASGSYVSAEEWNQGTIQFTGTGPVALTIYDTNDSTSVTLYLEVVDATNVTSYSGLGNQNSVLLNDITMPNNGKYYISNATLYGNGFTFDVVAGRDHDTEGGYVGGNYTVGVTDGVLDNVVIVGEVYTEYGGTVTSKYNFPTVATYGNSVIANCYISNGASAVRVGSGCNLEIINTTLEGGNFANLDIRGGKIKLRNVTTINQSTADGKSISNDKKIVGLGIVVYTGSTVELDIEGLTQYNCISKNTSFSGEANTLKNVIFGGNYADYQFTYEGATWVNTGIVSMVAEVKSDNFTKLPGYAGKDASISTYDGYVYAPVGLSSVASPPAYTATEQYHIAPRAVPDHTINYNQQVSGSNDYCKYDETVTGYLISFDDGESFEWKYNIYNVTKGDKTYNYSVSVDNNATVNTTNQTIVFDEPGDYTVTYTYKDDVNYRLNNGVIETYSVTYTKTVHATVYEVKNTSAKTTFAFGSNGYRTETAENLTYVMPDVNVTSGTKNNGIQKVTVDGKEIFYPVVSMHKSGTSSWYNYFSVFEAVTITDLNEAVYSTNSTAMPSGLTVIGGFILNASGNVSTAESANGTGIFNYSTGKEIKCSTYSGYGLCYYPDSQFTSSTNSRDEQTIVVKYRYTDSNGTPYYYYIGYWCEKHEKSCVTPDTLITLADGSQVRVDSLTGNEQLMVWNMETGKLDSAPIMFVDSEEEAEYEIIHLYFSDGTDVKVIYEHGFWDYDLNKYVYLDADAAQYIGHTFAKQNGSELAKVKLTNVVLETEVTTAWSPVTEDHLCYFVNGMLSMPGGVGGLFNIFDVNPETMAYDYEAMARDIETYGLFTYEELNAIAPLSEDMFNAAGGAYLKVSIGKGNLTMEELIGMINRYSKFF